MHYIMFLVIKKYTICQKFVNWLIDMFNDCLMIDMLITIIILLVLVTSAVIADVI